MSPEYKSIDSGNYWLNREINLEIDRGVLTFAQLYANLACNEIMDISILSLQKIQERRSAK